MSRYPRPSFAQNPEYYQTQVNAVNRLVNGNEEDCHEQLRVNRFTFFRLCCLVRSVGLGDSRFVCVEERVAIFLWILGHHTKQRRTKFEFWRSIETISRHFNAVLQAVLGLHKMLLVSPEPVPADYHDQRWSWFQIWIPNKALKKPMCLLKKTPRSRRHWRKVEEDALIKVMLDEFSDKWSADNGFKPGFFSSVEKQLEKVLPESHLKVDPHIESKVKYWRQTYNKVFDILQLSGFGWDHTNKKVEVEKSVWDEYEKAHPKKAKEVYGKTFPYYDDWAILFGRDRATGAGAEDPTQMEQVYTPNPLQDSGVDDVEDFYAPLFDDQFMNSPHVSVSSTPTSSTPHTETPSIPTPTGSTPDTATPSTFMPQPPPRRMQIPMSSTLQANAKATKGRKRTRMGDVEDVREELGHWCVKRAWAIWRNWQIPLAMKRKRVDQFLNTRDERKQAWAEAVLNGHVYGPIT
ncbi:hypothetical protein Acr_03g0010640 [Actinidia rufa]|uniref:Myb/SANT-like domain-containing protein n=1 Tax=Actinidia rufa TaxID=165716 RepID=A0A7J0ED28_9ERIC|nr:hypothetical protein Acr_03g0010640 [Actinidia rufa]